MYKLRLERKKKICQLGNCVSFSTAAAHELISQSKSFSVGFEWNINNEQQQEAIVNTNYSKIISSKAFPLMAKPSR